MRRYKNYYTKIKNYHSKNYEKFKKKLNPELHIFSDGSFNFIIYFGNNNKVSLFSNQKMFLKNWKYMH